MSERSQSLRQRSSAPNSPTPSGRNTITNNDNNNNAFTISDNDYNNDDDDAYALHLSDDDIGTNTNYNDNNNDDNDDYNNNNDGRDGIMKTSSVATAAISPRNNNGTTTTDSTTTGIVVVEESDIWQTIAGIAGNVLEWYDFAVFGYFGDIIGKVFFPPQKGDANITESFVVFGGAFLMRPIGGLLLGYIGDTYGRKKALILSIFLMAFPTFIMGCLPGYDTIGDMAIVLLVVVRLLQGLSVGGQLMSSLVYTLESHNPTQWGLYGSFVMAAANFGTLLGGLVGFIVRSSMSEEDLISYGWRIPFLSGIFVSISGFYLKSHGPDHDGHHYQPPGTTSTTTKQRQRTTSDDDYDDNDIIINTKLESNPVRQAFARENLRSLLAASMVPMLWSAGFYLCFVWMAIFMADLIDPPVPGAFGVNSLSLLFSVCLFFPYAGKLSDTYGRKYLMKYGALGMGIFSPILVVLIGRGQSFLSFICQCCLGIFLSLWGAPMCAWLVEEFEPDARLTSISVGYNIAQAIAGGSTPFIATMLVDHVGPGTPGFILTVLAIIAGTGLLCVAPPPSAPASVTAIVNNPNNNNTINNNNNNIHPPTLAEIECEMTSQQQSSSINDGELI